MVKDFFRGFGYTIGKILAFIFIGIVSAIIFSKIDISKIPFKQLIMKSIFIDTYAQSVSGYFNMYYVKSTNSGTIPQSYTSTLGFNFPTNTYTQLAGSTLSGNTSQHQFSVITQAQFAPTFNFTKGNLYTLTFNFDTGSYIIPYFPTNNSNWFVSACTNGVCSYQNVTSTYTYSIDSTHTSTNTLQLVIKFTATATGSTTITIGNLTDNSGVFYNQYSSQQGIRISSATIDEVEQSIDLSPIIDNQNQNTQSIINNQNSNTTIINNSINDINDTLTDTTQPNTSDFFDDLSDYVPSMTPITDLLNMPYNLINKFLNGFNGSCSSINLGSLYGTSLILPCIDLGSLLGSQLWGIVDILFVGMMCLNIGELLIHDFNSLLTLNDEFESTYTPKHIYHPKHGKE